MFDRRRSASGVGILAAYVFSRMRFAGRAFLMLAILAVLMLPAVATLAPLFTLLNRIQIRRRSTCATR